MRATGWRKADHYRHFDSKQELAGDAFTCLEDPMDTRFEGTDEIPNTVDRLKQIVGTFGTDAVAGAGGCPLRNTAIDS